MKKIFICILAVLICFSVFSACENSQQPTSQQPTSQQPTSQKAVVEISPPNDRYVYHFDSYDEIIDALTVEDTDEFDMLRAEQEKWGKVYMDTLSAFTSNDIKVAIPQLDGSNINIRDLGEGYSKIALMTCELFRLPWVWYHCVVGDYYLRVKVAYPWVLGSEEIDSATSYYEAVSFLPIESPTPDNFYKFENYKYIYEKEIVLADGRKVTAMICKLKDTSYVYVRFYQDGMFIILYADNQLFTDEFWSSFSMVQYDAEMYN